MSAAGDDARRLPTGAHGIPPDVVSRNQRERLVAAMAEACGEHGYAETSVTELASRAAVSTATFYKLFSSKRDCALEAHRELLERLLEEVDASCQAVERPEKIRAGVRKVLSLLAADPPTARLLTVEILALGSEGVERHDVAIEAFAARLRAGRDRQAAAPPNPHAEWVLVAGVAMLIGKRVSAGGADGLPALEPELVALTSPT